MRIDTNTGKDCQVWRFLSDSGEGVMTGYMLFPGVMLLFNDFHMEFFDSAYEPHGNMLAIDHCREGRMEYKAGKDTFSYVTAGDVKLDSRQTHTGRFVFPSGHFHGVTLAFACGRTSTQTKNTAKSGFCGWEGVPTPEEFLQKFSVGQYPVVLRGAENLDRIFSQMYQVPEEIRIPYLKAKVIELLLQLQMLKAPEAEDGQLYFHRSQVEKVKAVHNFLMEHMEEAYTQEEMAKRFNIGLTVMKQCHKFIYGETIGEWLTSYRMMRAADMLTDRTDVSVAQVAGTVGYDSASKFAAAFKRSMGQTPTEYRMNRERTHLS